ncbi:hypothetical protein Tco_0348098 [Tanacetum coccineum]
MAFYDHESWNDPKDLAKPVKAISFPHKVPSTSDRRLIELENRVQRLMEAHLAPKSSVQVNKTASSCEICSGPHDTQICMENPKQAFVCYASLRTDEAGDARLSEFGDDFKQQQSEMTNKIDTLLKTINDRITGALPSDTVKNLKLNVNSTSTVLSAHSYPIEILYEEHLPGELEIARNTELNPFKDVLVFRKMVEFLGAIHINLKGNMWESEDLIEKKIDWKRPPKEGDGAWHIKIEIIDPDGENFDIKLFNQFPQLGTFS